MSTFEGTFRIRFHDDKGITLDRGIAASTLTAADADKALDLMVENATKLKCGFDRWTLYIPGVNEKLQAGDKQISVAKVKAALKEPGATVELYRGKFGLPKMVIAPAASKVTKKVSKFTDLA